MSRPRGVPASLLTVSAFSRHPEAAEKASGDYRDFKDVSFHGDEVVYTSCGDGTTSEGGANSDGSISVRLYHKPLVLLIWLGAVVMFAGGALSLSDRRLRVGAPKPAKSLSGLQVAE